MELILLILSTSSYLFVHIFLNNRQQLSVSYPIISYFISPSKWWLSLYVFLIAVYFISFIHAQLWSSETFNWFVMKKWHSLDQYIGLFMYSFCIFVSFSIQKEPMYWSSHSLLTFSQFWPLSQCFQHMESFLIKISYSMTHTSYNFNHF